MERFSSRYDKEYMKMAMLKQEETFKEQVNELHRLYRVQKQLMREMRSYELKRQRMAEHFQRGRERWNVENTMNSHQACHAYRDNRKSRKTLDLELPAEDFIGNDNADAMEFEQECEIELTLATGRSPRKKEETSVTSDSGVSFSSSTAESAGEILKYQEWGLYQIPSDRRKSSGFNVEEPVRQERLKQPPWLFQCLSLNMT